MLEKVCCFLGHRNISRTEELKKRISDTVEDLIVKFGVDTFLFGSKSEYDSLCLEAVTELKKKYPHIRRIYVRAEFPAVSESYTAYLLGMYDGTYYPERLSGAGKAVYIERNCEMINKSKYCIVYLNEQDAPTNRKSGTLIAYEYAVKKRRTIINLA